VAQYSQRTLVGQAVSSFGKGSGEPAMITKVDAFTATNASYTVPAGVTYMVAYIRGGGGGCGLSSAGAGGNSSVAFAGGTITATGGVAANRSLGVDEPSSYAGTANSGLGARGGNSRSGDKSIPWTAQDGALITAGGDVTAGATLAVTVGAGGTAGSSGAAGGSGYVYLEYQVKA
jgi:hypothetical protein